MQIIMSIRFVKGIGAKFFRRAYIISHGHLYFTPRQQTLLPSISAYAHCSTTAKSALFQMVKKRSIEARTKLQPGSYPDSSPITPPTPTQFSANARPSPSPTNTSAPKKLKSDAPKPKECENTQVLRAAGCDKDKKIGAVPPPPSGSGPPGSGKGKRPDDTSGALSKYLIGIIAALGGAGLLLWLTGGSDKREVTKEVCKKEEQGTFKQPAKIPASSADLPKHVPYILIGSGTAAFSAFRAIKSNDPKAKVLMLTDEHRKPYMRPPLSKELWYSAAKGGVSKDYRFKQWTGAERSLYFEPEEFFVEPEKLTDTVNGGIAVAQGHAVKKVDPTNRVVTLTDGYEIGYDECLIATGCSPKNLPVFLNASSSVKEKVMVYRTPDDFERLKDYIDKKKTVTIIGNGFIGSELACSLANYAKDKCIRVNQVFQESGNMSKVLPDYLSKWTMKKVQQQGVCVMPNASVREVQRDESNLKLTLNNGTILLTDIVVVCVGCEPNTSIASLSGLEVDRSLGGFLVNAELEARRNLFVAGDASCFYDPLLGRRRVEHHDHSVVSGRLAGENMVGKKKAYTHQSMFWSDLGPEIGYEGIGLVDAALPTVGVFALPSSNVKRSDNLKEEEIAEIESEASLENTEELPEVKCNVEDDDYYGRGVIFYLKDDKVVGILLWNLFNRIGLARTLINQNKKYDDLNEVAKLFEIHS